MPEGGLWRIRALVLVLAILLLAGACGREQADRQENGGDTTQPAGQETTAAEGTQNAGGETTAREEEAPEGAVSIYGQQPEREPQENTDGEATGGETTGGFTDSDEPEVGEEDPETGLVFSDTLAEGKKDETGGLLVKNRLITYYGHPSTGQMGILGQSEPAEAVAQLKEQAKEWTEADPERPALPAIELIASVAQPVPGPDGLYLTRLTEKDIEEYARVAEEEEIPLILDVQIGYSTIMDELEQLRPFLERPYVHLAIDPEYDMDEGEIPGQQFGTSDGREIQAAVEELGRIVEENDLPPKIVVVHQFQFDMILNKEAIQPTENVAVVLHADGFGAPEEKFVKYDQLVRDQPIQYGGFKLFYEQDAPLLSPGEVLDRLEPKPAVISYQ